MASQDITGCNLWESWEWWTDFGGQQLAFINSLRIFKVPKGLQFVHLYCTSTYIRPNTYLWPQYYRNTPVVKLYNTNVLEHFQRTYVMEWKLIQLLNEFIMFHWFDIASCFIGFSLFRNNGIQHYSDGKTKSVVLVHEHLHASAQFNCLRSLSRSLNHIIVQLSKYLSCNNI